MTIMRFAPALALPLVVAGSALVSVSSNRGGGRDPIELTHREASVTPGDDENSAAMVFLSWQGAPSTPDSWLNREKLAALGLDVSVDPAAPEATEHYRRLLPRDRYVAFELDGPAWQALVGAAERAETQQQLPRGGLRLRENGSRLVAVDADTDGDVVSARYPNARTHLVTAGRIRVTRHQPRGEPPYLTGSIENIEPRRIHVPRELASALLPRRFDAAPPSLTVSIRYGRNFEPWVVGISMK